MMVARESNHSLSPSSSCHHLEIDKVNYVAVVFWMLLGTCPEDWLHEITTDTKKGNQVLRLSLVDGKPPFFKNPMFILGNLVEMLEFSNADGTLTEHKIVLFPQDASRTEQFIKTFHPTKENQHIMEVDLPFKIEKCLQKVRIPSLQGTCTLPNPYFLSTHHELYKDGKIPSADVSAFMKLVRLYKLDFILLRAVDPRIKDPGQKAESFWGRIYSSKGGSHSMGGAPRSFASSGKKHKPN